MKVAAALVAAFFLVAESKQLKPVSENAAESYLEKYGYLGEDEVLVVKAMRTAGNTNTISREREAIIQFQAMAGLNVTGQLDESTRLKMAQPRCGVSDVHAYVSSANTKWNKNALTYMIEAYTTDITQAVFRSAVQEAFDVWSAVTPLKFSYVPSNADIKIKFGRVSHGDPWPFDGKGNVLAHATLPYSELKGLLHFDDDESWVYKEAQKLATLDYTDIVTVAVHEIGHVLGLDHSNDQKAIMSAFYKEPTDRYGNYIEPKLGTDDITKIQNLYGKNTGGSSSGGATTKAPVTTKTTTKYVPQVPSWTPWWPGWGWNSPRFRYQSGGDSYSNPSRSGYFTNLNHMFGYY